MVVDRVKNSGERRERRVSWGVGARVLCVVFGVVLMAVAVKARLSHDPAFTCGHHTSLGHLDFYSEDHFHLFMIRYRWNNSDRTILGSNVPVIEWEFGRHMFLYFDPLTGEVSHSATRITDMAVICECYRQFGHSDSQFHSLSFGAHPCRGVTRDLHLLAFDMACDWVLQSPNHSVPVSVTTELDYPSLWVHAGQFLTVHPWVFGAGALLFGGGAVWLFVARIVAARRGRKGRCRRCGYALVGIVEVAGERGERIVVCPECGTVEGASKPGSSEGRQ